ncbi:MAG TPA: hypothetical protein VN226_01835, partial [Anaerolineales bacterium]|nr:hypothetical protein [Anaerolineales bacterium]
MKKRAVMLITVALLTCFLSSCKFNPGQKNSANNGEQKSIDRLMETWDDRSIYSSGLIGIEQDTLKELPGASVYHIDLEISNSLT